MSTEKLSELSKPVAYSLRFRNMNGEPDKTINANTTFSTLEKAEAYGLGNRYVTQDDGKIVCVRDPSQDPIVEPLYSQEYVSALLAELEAKDKRIAELDRSETQLIEERDVAHDAIDAMYEAATGERPEWSNCFGFADAIEEVAQVRARLATPVRLPTTSGRLGVAYTRVIPEVIEAIRAAGFSVEGDE